MLQVVKMFKNLQKQVVPDKKIDSQKKIIKWEVAGGNNNFPQQLLQNVYNSPVGSAAIDVWNEFVEGDGLLDKKAGNTVINDKTGQTLDELHAVLSPDLSSMDGFAIIQRYTTEGKPASRMHLPFEETRLGVPDDTGNIDKIYHNPYYGIKKDFDDSETKWFYDYNPEPEFVKKQIIAHNKEFMTKEGIDPPYPGQVFWFSIEKPLARVYPQPFYYSSINWFQVDAEIQQFHERNIKNNFLLSVLINMHGDPSAPAGPAEAKRLAEDPDATLDQSETVGGVFAKQMSEFSKADGSVLVNWFLKDEEKAVFEAFPTNSHHDLFIALQNITADQISIGTKVSKILLNISVPGQLGNNNEVLNAVALMQGRSRRKRNILKRAYEKVFDFVTDGTIKPVNYIDIIPDQIWEVMTDEEKRKSAAERFGLDLSTTTVTQLEESVIANISMPDFVSNETDSEKFKEILSMYMVRDIAMMNVWKNNNKLNKTQITLIDLAIDASNKTLTEFRKAS